MTTVVVAPSEVASFPEGGGHFWVYLQYVHALRRLGCDVYWLEWFRGSGDERRDAWALATFRERMERYGLGERLILYTSDGPTPEGEPRYRYIDVTATRAEAVFARADLLLNFRYATDATMLRAFRRTALVDIDPGLLQFWIGAGQLTVPRHDLYVTTGETVGTPLAAFPDCGVPWLHIRPSVCLALWPTRYDPACEAFTTVSNWWGGAGGGSGEWIADGQGHCYENTKRISFLAYVELPRLVRQPLELALNLSTEETDVRERQMLEGRGWRIRHAYEVAGTPEAYQSYVGQSRGEFSCAKPSCMRFRNAWVSDRTLCYLASGKPVVVQDTGPSSFLPNGDGMFRFSTLAEAAEALATVDAAYARHCRAAREIAEAYFDAERVLGAFLDEALR